MNQTAVSTVNEQTAKDESSSQYVSFFLEHEEYGVEILLVQEIISFTQPTQVPNADKTVQGMINFRGKIIPLFDLRAKFGLPEKEEDSLTVTIVLGVKEKTIGFVVDQVNDIVSLSQRNIQVVDEEVTNDLKAKHLKGMGKIDDRLILLLDLDKTVDFGDVNKLQ
jgi:purine-binding chemotaxis protein CheW